MSMIKKESDRHRASTLPTGRNLELKAQSKSTSEATANTLALVLAGGKGTRLSPLTQNECKPAIPFGGAFRIIDFTLSNCINSGIRRIGVLTQYRQHSLLRHLRAGWDFLNREFNEYVEPMPAQQCEEASWYCGTADAIYQNIDFIKNERSEHVLVLAGDHIYKADYRRMLSHHIDNNADISVACLEVPRDEARQFGVVGTDKQGRIISFDEKPLSPATLPGKQNISYASMGIYVFRTSTLINLVEADASRADSSHDFGTDIIPAIIRHYRVLAYPYVQAQPCSYWQDVGTLDAYFQANMALLEPHPAMDLHDSHWPIHTHYAHLPPARFTYDDENCLGTASGSIVASGSVVSGAQVRHSILFSQAQVREYSSISNCLLLPGVSIGRGCNIRNAIFDSGVQIPDGTLIGFNRSLDEAHFAITPRGIVIVTANAAALKAHAAPLPAETPLTVHKRLSQNEAVADC